MNLNQKISLEITKNIIKEIKKLIRQTKKNKLSDEIFAKKIDNIQCDLEHIYLKCVLFNSET